MKEETIKLIEEKFKDSTVVYHPNSPLSSSRQAERAAAIWALTNPDILASEGLSRNEWVSVKDRLPIKDGTYLCYDFNIPSIYKADVYYFRTLNNEWYVSGDAFHPAYWMPLPTLPNNI